MNIKTVLDVDVLSAAPIFSILIHENEMTPITQFDGSMLKYQLKFNLQFILILFLLIIFSNSTKD